VFQRRLIAVWIGIAVLGAMFVLQQGIWPPCEPVKFQDPKLARHVRETVKLLTHKDDEKELCVSEARWLPALFASGAGISDLTGLEHCTDLTQLVLSNNEISELEPLKGLWTSSLPRSKSSRFSDVEPLAALTEMFSLDLRGNRITDIHPLAGLTGLLYLFLDNNQISDIQPLAGLTRLFQLGLGDNQISDIRPLAGLRSIVWLGLQNNRISDIDPLVDMRDLNTVNLRNNRITEIYPLVENPGLGPGDRVDLTLNPLSQVSCTKYVPELESKGVSVLHDCEQVRPLK
jgi:internalin A